MENIKFWHRVRLADGTYTPGIVNHGPDGGDWPTTRFGMPEDLTGLSVLDIGAWDGFFSFEAERRGARLVVAANVPEGPKYGRDAFEFIRDNLDSGVEELDLDVQSNCDAAEGLEFDLVLLYGVLYHVKDPLLALENCAQLTVPGGVCLVETAVTDIVSDKPILEYRPGFEDDPTNFFYPNDAWMETASVAAGFKSCVVVGGIPSRRTYKLVR